MKAEGLEPSTYGLKDCGSQAIKAESATGSAAVVGAVAPRLLDADLARIIDAWPTLPEPIRRAILTLADSCQ